MTPERYQALLRWLEARPALKKLVIALNRWLPAVPFACYPLLLVLLNVRWFRLLSANRAAALDFMQLIARAVFVPAFVFLGGTLLRARLNFPRPYEQPGFTPLVPKDKKPWPLSVAPMPMALAALSPAPPATTVPGRRPKACATSVFKPPLASLPSTKRGMCAWVRRVSPSNLSDQARCCTSSHKVPLASDISVT